MPHPQDGALEYTINHYIYIYLNYAVLNIKTIAAIILNNNITPNNKNNIL